MSSPLPFCYQVTKYDPADRDERGFYIGSEDVRSDHGPVEEAYLAAVAAFAEDLDVTTLSIREPTVGIINFGVEPFIDGHGLGGLFPADLAGFHDGAVVSVTVALELVRVMLRGNGAGCSLEVADRFLIQVGYDQYVYISCATPCDRAVAITHDLGLFADPIRESLYLPEPPEAPVRVADSAFWQDVVDLLVDRGPLLLEEGFVANVSRWHRLTPDRVQGVRAGLTPRSRLWLWPDLSTDVAAALALLVAENRAQEVVWEGKTGKIRSRLVWEEEDHLSMRADLADARAASVLSTLADERHPLMTAVLPDPDGVLRARWDP